MYSQFSTLRTIILAAGQGKRMFPLTKSTPKPLLPIEKSNVLSRLISQVLARTSGEVCVVVGHAKELIMQEVIGRFGHRVRMIENVNYQNDVNIGSLTLALQDNNEPFILFESDCVFDDEAMDVFFNPEYANKSCWYTAGPFLSSQVGGILKSNELNEVIDLKIVEKYDVDYSSYRKMVGVLKVGKDEILEYIKLLNLEFKNNTRQYYHAPWIKNLNSFHALEVPLDQFNVGAFNTRKEYMDVLQIFKESA